MLKNIDSVRNKMIVFTHSNTSEKLWTMFLPCKGMEIIVMNILVILEGDETDPFGIIW